MSITYEIIKDNPQEILNRLKKKLYNESIESLEKNASYECLFKEIKKEYHREKCDACYLFTFASANITRKTHINFFSKILFSYAQLYLEKGDCIRSMGVISQYITNASQFNQLNMERNDIIAHVFDDFYTFMKQYPKNMNRILYQISIVSLSNSKPNSNFFFLLIQCLSLIESNDMFAIEQFITFYNENEQEIKNRILNDQKRLETFIKLLSRIVETIFKQINSSQYLDKEIGQLFNLSIRILSIILTILFEKDNDNNTNSQSKKMIFDIVIVNLTKISILFSKGMNKKEFNCDYFNNLNDFIDKAICNIEKYLENDNNNKTLKIYSTVLGKAENIYANIDNIHNRNKYSMKIVEMYKKYKYSSIDLLRVKVNLFKSFVSVYFSNDIEANEKFNYEAFQSHINELIILINSTYLHDDNEKEYFNGMVTFLIKLIENSIFNEIHKGNQFEKLSITVDYIYISFSSILSNKQNILLNDFGLYIDMLYLISIETKYCINNSNLEREKKKVNLLKVFNSLIDNKEAQKINCYSQIIAYFLCFNNKLDILKEKIINLSFEQNDIKSIICFYHHIMYFINKGSSSILKDSSELLVFLFETINIIIAVIDTKCNIISYKEIKESFERDLLTSFTIVIKNEFNKLIQNMDLYDNSNELKDNKDLIQYLNALFKHIQRLIRINEKITSILFALNNSNEILTFTAEVNCNSHLDILINIAIKLYTYSKPYNLILLQNPQILDNSFTNKNYLLYIKLILTSLIKNQSLIKQKNSLEYQYKFNQEISDLISTKIQTRNATDDIHDDNVKDSNKVNQDKSKSENNKNKKYFFYKNIHSYLNIKTNDIFLDECISYQLSNNTKSKVDFIINQTIIKSIIEKNLFLGSFENIENNEIINQLISNNIDYITNIIHPEDKNNKDRINSYKTLHYILLIHKSIIVNQKDIIEHSMIINIINYIPFFSKNNTLKTNIDQVIIVKLLSLFYQKYHLILSKDIYDTITSFLNKSKANLASERLNRNFSLFEYIAYLDINYALYTISLKANTLIMKDGIQEGKELLENLVSMYKTELTQRAKDIIDNVELLKSRVSLSFICNYRFIENSFLALLGLIDYQSIVLDTITKISQLTQVLFIKLNQNGFCNIVLKMYSLIDKTSFLCYNKQFILFALELLIKITRNIKRNSMINLIRDDFGFDSFSDFVGIIGDIIFRYLNIKYNVDYCFGDSNKQYKKIDILENDIRDIAIKYNIRDIVIDKFFHSNVTINQIEHCDNNMKRITSMLKYNLLANDIEDNGINNKELFEQIYFNNDMINEEDILAFYIKNFNNIKFKHHIKLIPYVYPHIFVQRILNENNIQTILNIFSNEFNPNNKLKCINDYKRIKHIKKVLTELIYFTTKNDHVIHRHSIENLLLFYIKYLLNFKYRLYSNQYFKKDNEYYNSINYTNNVHDNDEGLSINFISLFRIKQSLFFCIKYKERLYFNVIPLNTKQVKNIFSSLEANLNKTNTSTKIIKHTVVSKLEANLDNCFYQLQSILISANIMEGLIKIYTDNTSFNSYLNKKLIKYPMAIQSKQEFIKNLFTLDQSGLKPTLSSKRTISLSEYLPKLRKKLHGVKKTKMSLYDKLQGLLYYIPSGNLSSLPIENLPWLFKLPITRLINYSIIQDNSEYHLERIKHISLSPNEIFCLLNPSKDLIDSEKLLNPIIQKNSIENIIGKGVTNEEMESKLLNKKMFIYCGHGDGTKYLTTSYIKNTRINFISLLFGCSSVCVNNYIDKDTQPFGLPHYYQINHCPFLLGFLWAITSRDIDQFLLSILNTLFEKKTISLIEVILLFKSKISNKNLNAASLVIYSDKDICMTINN